MSFNEYMKCRDFKNSGFYLPVKFSLANNCIHSAYHNIKEQDRNCELNV